VVHIHEAGYMRYKKGSFTSTLPYSITTGKEEHVDAHYYMLKALYDNK
jgi:hypothetical protein